MTKGMQERREEGGGEMRPGVVKGGEWSAEEGGESRDL